MKWSFSAIAIIGLGTCSITAEQILAPVVLKEHVDAISLALSPDGTMLASADLDGMIRLWNLAADGKVVTLSGNRDPVTLVTFSSDGRTLASVSDGKRIKLWDTATAKNSVTFECPTRFGSALALSSDCTRAATGNDNGAITTWDLVHAKSATTIKAHEDKVRFLVASPDGKNLASLGADGSIKVWDASTGRRLANLGTHEGLMVRLIFSQDGKTLASGLGQGLSVKLWDVTRGKKIADAKMSETLGPPAMVSPDARVIAAVKRRGNPGSGNEIALWAIASDRIIATLTGHTENLRFLGFSPVEGTLVSGSPAEILIWDLSKGRVAASYKWNVMQPGLLTFSRDGKAFAICADANTIMVFRAGVGKGDSESAGQGPRPEKDITDFPREGERKANSE